MMLEVFNWVNIMLGNINNGVMEIYHTVSGKHLPRHLVEFIYRLNHRYDFETMLPELGYLAARTPPMRGGCTRYMDRSKFQSYHDNLSFMLIQKPEKHR